MADKIRGKDISIFINGLIAGCIQEASFEVETSMIDATSKCDVDSGGALWANNMPNINSWSVSGSGLQPVVGSGGQPQEYSMQQLLAAQFTQQKVYVVWSDVNGQFLYGGDAYLSSVSTDANFDDLVSFDFELTGSGPITTQPVS